ncbi:MAG: hypothetical protein COV69_04010 [Parcubacteria group bacterium CG11_big_fil_rev_8_21_14_0_20_39_14]|nr:MAG: hypothetical protein COV69_04010 [Parcubacteria group bacterium CG11_big_fil_rev_8_21_14_0_20_39_14]PIS35686.1 MAG: hypothetical protein COT36_01095 [Parcubacteria group bacterium CG08_land_8_20_14_0_20_38_56]
MSVLPSQKFIEIADIKNNALVMKNGTLRSVLACSSINFALKSEDEQNALLYQFQNFLNSLDFPVQFIIQSRKINIEDYLKTLEKFEEGQENELLKLQISEYREFIKALVEGVNIMTKSFYFVVPFSVMETKGTMEVLGARKAFRLREEDLQRCRSQLLQRVEFLVQGLRRCGVHSVMLGDLELTELFWAMYNPKLAETGQVPIIG